MPVDVPYNPDFAPEVLRAPRSAMEPQNIEAEKSVLAACLLNQEAIEDVAAKLIPDNFYRPPTSAFSSHARPLHASYPA